jgi:phosphoglycolate phosphatase
VDSVPDIAAALNRTLAKRGLAAFTDRETALMVGDGSDRLLARAFAARGAVPDAGALPELVADYAANASVATRLFPGVPEMLATMRGQGWMLAVCTNKLEAPARALLAGFGILGLMAAHAVMLGDHANDVQAARAAGMPAIFAGWGYGPPAMAEGAAAVAARIADVPALATKLLRLG